MVTSSASEVQKIQLSNGSNIVPGLGYGLFVTKSLNIISSTLCYDL
jgi:hypothetical protein